jgi:hypothetical protein
MLNLFPKDVQFFDLFELQADYIVRAAPLCQDE